MDIGLSIMVRCLASECPRPQRAGQFDGRAIMAGTTHHKVLIVGGGTAGITVAASLKRHGPGGIDIAIVEPSDTHYYQPAFSQLTGDRRFESTSLQRRVYCEPGRSGPGGMASAAATLAVAAAALRLANPCGIS